MNAYDIETTFAEMVRNGHTKFEFRFRSPDGLTTWSDIFYQTDAQTLVDEMCLTTYDGEGDEECLTVWNVDSLS